MSRAAAPIADISQRQEALDIERSFCVQAPAGSGKTELLTQRILKLLAYCRKPEEVLAITFTRKAAQEMRQRLLQSLREARAMRADEIAAQAGHRRRTLEFAAAALRRGESEGWRLLDNTSRLRITTIDSFNSQLTGQLPLTSHFGGQVEISDDIDALYREAVRETLSRLEDGADEAAPLEALLAHLNDDLRQAERLLCQLLANRDQWMSDILAISRDPSHARGFLEDSLRQLIGESLTHMRELLAPWSGSIMTLLAFAADNLALEGDDSLLRLECGSELPETEPECLPQWKGVLSFLLTKKMEYRKKVDKRDGFPTPAKSLNPEEKALFQQRKADFLALMQDLGEQHDLLFHFRLLLNLPDPRYRDGQWRVLEALTRVLPMLAARLDLVMRRHGQADYLQVAAAALDALGEDEAPSDLALRLDYRIRHILVDEFQDTSSSQVRLLERLCRGWEPGDGRTLFIVGDGMQSCYGFRNANVGLFLQARDRGIGQVRLESLRLQVNFRSETAVVEWVNRIFSGSFPAGDDLGRGAVRYSPSVGLHRERPDAGVETLLLVRPRDPEGEPADVRWQEAAETTALVRHIREQAPDDSLAILVRNRNHLNQIVPSLREAGIPWHASDIDPLSSYPEIRDLMTLCRALLNLADSTSWLALLRAPWLGLPLRDIHLLACHARQEESSLFSALRAHSSLPELSDDATARLRRALPVLEHARAARQRQPLREWLEGAWLSLGGPAALPPEANLDNIEQFFQLLESQSLHGDITDIHGLEEKLAAVYGSSEAPGGAALQIMTIHKAKGLEFDHVIIPGLDRLPRGDDNPLLRWRQHLSMDGGEHLLIGLPAGKGQDSDSVYDYLKYESGLRAALENTRLMYIGVTRAARKAYLLGVVSEGRKEGELQAPAANSLLGTLWEQLIAGGPGAGLALKPLARGAPAAANDAERVELRSRRLPSDWQAPWTMPAAPEEASPPLDPQASPHRNLYEKRLGDIIHHCLRLAAEGRLDLGNEAALAALAPSWERRLRAVCADTAGAAAHVRRDLANVLAHPEAPFLLSPDHEDGACELALRDFNRGGREYVIDRTFIDGEGRRWIIDYKSSAPRAGQALDDFLREQEALYRGQLDDYARLFREMEDRPATTALLFTAVPYLHILE